MRVRGPVGLEQHRAGRRRAAAEQLVHRVALAGRVPREPQLRPRLAQGRAQQVQAADRQGLRLLDPGDVVALQRLDALGGVVLHALEDDAAAPRPQDAVGQHPEVAAEAQRLDLVLDQPLDRLVERALHLADAHRPHRRRLDAAPHQQLGERVRLAGAAAAMHGLVARRRQQPLEGGRQAGRGQGGQRRPGLRPGRRLRRRFRRVLRRRHQARRAQPLVAAERREPRVHRRQVVGVVPRGAVAQAAGLADVAQPARHLRRRGLPIGPQQRHIPEAAGHDLGSPQHLAADLGRAARRELGLPRRAGGIAVMREAPGEIVPAQRQPFHRIGVHPGLA